MGLPNPGMDAVPFTSLPAEFLDDMIENIEALSAGTGLAAGSVGFANLLSTIFGGQVTTYTNPGSAGGTNTFFYINLGGIKLFWGHTDTQSIGGAAPASAPVSITFPVGFFTTIQTAVATPGPESGTQYDFLGTNTINTTSWSINFSIVSGSAGVFNANVLVIGT